MCNVSALASCFFEDLGEKYADNEFDKANMLNNYFSTCFSTSLPPLSGSYETAEHLELLEGTHESLLCTEEYVMDLLQNIDVSKVSASSHPAFCQHCK